MTRFDDGPAKGTTMRLMRAPYFLRVCVGPLLDDTDDRPKIDALDQVDDVPRAHEQLFAYRLTAPAGWMHVRASGGRGGFQTLATYALVEKQPTDDEMRNQKNWERWCEAHRPADFPYMVQFLTSSGWQTDRELESEALAIAHFFAVGKANVWTGHVRIICGDRVVKSTLQAD